MSSAKKLMGTTAVGGALAIEDVFSTYLYTGNGSTQTITTNVDITTDGGMIWFKTRTGTIRPDHILIDTERPDAGSGYPYLVTNSTAAQAITETPFYAGSGYEPTSTGFVLGQTDYANYTGQTYASWTWRKAPRFFDVLTYTGTGSAQNISHNLGATPGCIIVKQTGGTTNWSVYHRSMDATAPEDYYMALNLTNAKIGPGASQWNSTAPTGTQFTVGTGTNTNSSGATYVAYLFAHDPLGPSGDGSDGLIACGSYTGNGSEAVIDLGWEPQWLLIKDATKVGAWVMLDNMRSMSETSQYFLQAEASSAENTAQTLYPRPTATGFRIPTATNDYVNQNGQTFIYIAIRRGPMRQPTSGTEVYSAFQRSGGSGVKNTTGWPIDAQWVDGFNLGSVDFWVDRLRGISTTSTASGNYLNPQMTSSETSASCTQAWDNTGYVIPSYISGFGNHMEDCFRRAPGFFDVVAYSGNSTTTWYDHSLQAVPELILVKSRNSAEDWSVYSKDRTGTNKILVLNANSAEQTILSPYDFPSTPTETQFRLGTNSRVNSSGNNYIAYLFATLPGVSKVGSYTGNGTSQTIDCGFTTGARFILIKRTNSAGSWCKYNYALGINAGTEQVIRLDQDYFSTADVSAADEVDPNSSGFVVNQLSTNNLNVSGGTYIYLAIA